MWGMELRGRGSSNMKPQRAARHCLAFLSLESFFTQQANCEAIAEAAEKCTDTWYRHKTGRWMTSSKKQSHSCTVGGPAHMEKKQNERTPAFKCTHNKDSKALWHRLLIYCWEKEPTSNYYYLHIITIFTVQFAHLCSSILLNSHYDQTKGHEF